MEGTGSNFFQQSHLQQVEEEADYRRRCKYFNGGRDGLGPGGSGGFGGACSKCNSRWNRKYSLL
jgi:hypothetical protein